MNLFYDKYRIESTRLPGYDYSRNGHYFVTICTVDCQCFFGRVINGKMELNDIGEIAVKCLVDIPKHFSFVVLDEFVIMPNHVHGIIIIDNSNIGSNRFDDTQNFARVPVETLAEIPVETRHGASLQESPLLGVSHRRKGQHYRTFGPLDKNSLSLIINQYKGAVKRWCNQNDHFEFTWQESFYDHIVRSKGALYNTRNYIQKNPGNWWKDQNNRPGLLK